MDTKIKTAASILDDVISSIDRIQKQAEEAEAPVVEEKDKEELPVAADLIQTLNEEADKMEKEEAATSDEKVATEETPAVAEKKEEAEKGKAKEEANSDVAATKETQEVVEEPVKKAESELTEEEAAELAELLAEQDTKKEAPEKAEGVNPSLPIGEEDVVQPEEESALLTEKEAMDAMYEASIKVASNREVSMMKKAGVPILNILKRVTPGLVSGGIGGTAGFYIGKEIEEKKDEVEDNMIYNVGIQNGAVAMAHAINEKLSKNIPAAPTSEAPATMPAPAEVPGGANV